MFKPDRILFYTITILVIGAYIHYVARDLIISAVEIITTIVVAALALVVFSWGIRNVLIGWETFLTQRANRKLAELEAQMVLTIVPAGSQLYTSETRGKLVSTLEHKNLSLSPGRVNGADIQYTIEERERWAFWNSAHSTAKTRERSTLEETPMIEQGGYPLSVNLLDLLPNGSSFHRVVLGLHITEDGSQEIITAAMDELTHIAVGGTSGWGKSVCLRSLAYQMASCPEPTKLVFIDSDDMTFSAFKSSDRLLYPVADNAPDAEAIVSELTAEMGNRKVLFAQHTTVEKLSDYNRVSNTPLPYILLFCDEATSLLKANKSLEQAFSLQILRARKYGIMAILGGQSWKADVMDTTLRGQFSSTIHFHARDKSSSNVLLGSSDAANITQVGIAYAVLPGRPIVKMLSPKISIAQAMREIGDTLADVEMPRFPDAPDIVDKKEEQAKEIRRMFYIDKMTRTAISKELGYKEYSGTIVGRINRALKDQQALEDEGYKV